MRGQLAAELAGIQDVALIACPGSSTAPLLGSAWPYEVPMKGLGIGPHLGWLTAQLNARQPVRV